MSANLEALDTSITCMRLFTASNDVLSCTIVGSCVMLSVVYSNSLSGGSELLDERGRYDRSASEICECVDTLSLLMILLFCVDRLS